MIGDSSSDSDEPGTSTMTSRSSGRARVYKVTKNIRGESQLHVACIGGDLKSVELLLRKVVLSLRIMKFILCGDGFIAGASDKRSGLQWLDSIARSTLRRSH